MAASPWLSCHPEEESISLPLTLAVPGLILTNRMQWKGHQVNPKSHHRDLQPSPVFLEPHRNPDTMSPGKEAM